MGVYSLQDAYDYLRLCDGDDDYTKAVRMVTDAQEGFRSELKGMRDNFAQAVRKENKNKLAAREREIARLEEKLLVHKYREDKVRAALYAHPEDEDDT